MCYRLFSYMSLMFFKYMAFEIATFLSGRNAVDQIELILQYNADMNYQKKGKNKLGISPLHVACCYGNVDNVTSLIQAGANVNLIDESGNTCLHMAASHDISGIQPCVDFILVNGLSKLGQDLRRGGWCLQMIQNQNLVTSL